MNIDFLYTCVLFILISTRQSPDVHIRIITVQFRRGSIQRLVNISDSPGLKVMPSKSPLDQRKVEMLTPKTGKGLVPSSQQKTETTKLGLGPLISAED